MLQLPVRLLYQSGFLGPGTGVHLFSFSFPDIILPGMQLWCRLSHIIPDWVGN